jgi:murein DD-endopeptidase MepM/ murein hydrolase activator NlpD
MLADPQSPRQVVHRLLPITPRGLPAATLQGMDSPRALLVALTAVVAFLGLSLDAFAEAAAAPHAWSPRTTVTVGTAVAVAPGTAGTVAAGKARDASTLSASASGDWQWPLAPRPEVVTGFDPPATPYGPGHVGVDLLGWPGQPVTSVAAGTVAFAGQVAGVPVVSVQHGSERSTYQPVVAAVARGDTVAAGQLIGALSNAGSHCLPLTCLHLGRRLGETYVDPLELLGGGPVRLLPRHGVPLAYSQPGA